MAIIPGGFDISRLLKTPFPVLPNAGGVLVAVPARGASKVAVLMRVHWCMLRRREPVDRACKHEGRARRPALLSHRPSYQNFKVADTEYARPIAS